MNEKNTASIDPKLFLIITAISSMELCLYTTHRCLQKMSCSFEDFQQTLHDEKQRCIAREMVRTLEFNVQVRKFTEWLYDLIGMQQKFRNIVSVNFMEKRIAAREAIYLDGHSGLYALTDKALKKRQRQYSLSDISSRTWNKIEIMDELRYEIDLADIKGDFLASKTLYDIVHKVDMTEATPISRYLDEERGLMKAYESKIRLYI